jgi:hypothetical protein
MIDPTVKAKRGSLFIELPLGRMDSTAGEFFFIAV